MGLLVDTISSSVAVFNLAGALTRTGKADPLPRAAGARVLLLPQRQLLEWSCVQAARPAIYVIENPPGLRRGHRRVRTPGYVRDATDARLHGGLTQCCRAAPARSIAGRSGREYAVLQRRLRPEGSADRIAPAGALSRSLPSWRFDPEAYELALQSEGLPARENDLVQLDTLPEVFAPLVAVMRKKKKWAYQEGIAYVLAQDIAL